MAITCILVNVESNGNVSIWIQRIIAICKAEKNTIRFSRNQLISKKLKSQKQQRKSRVPDKLHRATNIIDGSAKVNTWEGIGAIFLWR
jgi:hypothetical protein